MIKSAALKKQQKANGILKQNEGSHGVLTKENVTEPSQNDDECKPIPTQESEQEVPVGGDDCDGKLSKKQKLNQKKKR